MNSNVELEKKVLAVAPKVIAIVYLLILSIPPKKLIGLKHTNTNCSSKVIIYRFVSTTKIETELQLTLTTRGILCNIQVSNCYDV